MRKATQLVRLTVLLGSLFVGVLAISAEAAVRAQGANRVALLVQHGDGSLATRCVTFEEQELTGFELLERSGLSFEYASQAGQGHYVTSIDGEGCPATDPFCEGADTYWSIWHLENGAWVYSQMGINGYTVQDGDVEGFAWGQGQAPESRGHQEICAASSRRSYLPLIQVY